MIQVYQWLVANGMWKDILAASIAVLVARLFAWKPFKRMRAAQDKIQDQLDTSTPGGLTDVLNAIVASQPGSQGGDPSQ
jgi:hypothetical protein